MTPAEAEKIRNDLATDPLKARAYLRTLDNFDIPDRNYSSISLNEKEVCRVAVKVFDDLHRHLVLLH